MPAWLDSYRRQWPRVAAVQAMALGGVSLLAGRKRQTDLRSLAVMNAMTMCAHQYEEYVDPGYFIQGVAHSTVMPKLSGAKHPYSPGALTAALLHIPIGLVYIRALRTQGETSASDWAKSLAVLGGFFACGVAAPNLALEDENRPYAFTEHQMGPYASRSEQ